MDNTVLIIRIIVTVATIANIAAIYFLGNRVKSGSGSEINALRLETERKVLEEKLKAATIEIKAITEATNNALQGQKEVFEQQIKALQERLSAVTSEFKTISEGVKENVAIKTEAQSITIGNQVDTVNKSLEAVNQIIKELEAKRLEQEKQSLAEVTTLKGEIQQVVNISAKLSEALTNNSQRGRFGEKIAEDLLRVCGLIEGVSYRKQLSQSIDENKFRPDFTFILPEDSILNMDVKFPLNNYFKYLEDRNDATAEQFIGDVKKHIKAIKDKGYINPQNRTLDYALVFIPVESVYQFILEFDTTNNLGLFEESIQDSIILCSPFNLYALLEVIHRAHINFKLQRDTSDILQSLERLMREWKKYCESVDEVEMAFSGVHKKYGELVQARKNKLNTEFERITAFAQEVGHANELSESISLIDIRASSRLSLDSPVPVQVNEPEENSL
jgi:DNA recombination protein RmuC